MKMCENALDGLLEADRRELEGRADTPLARHLERCERCRVRARVILDDTALLGRALERVTAAEPMSPPPGPDDRRAARRSMDAARSRTGGSGRLRWALPLAAAAAAAALLLVAEPSPPRGGWRPLTPEAPAATRTRPVVEPGQAGTVAVFETSDPDITVVWFFEQE